MRCELSVNINGQLRIPKSSRQSNWLPALKLDVDETWCWWNLMADLYVDWEIDRGMFSIPWLCCSQFALSEYMHPEGSWNAFGGWPTYLLVPRSHLLTEIAEFWQCQIDEIPDDMSNLIWAPCSWKCNNWPLVPFELACIIVSVESTPLRENQLIRVRLIDLRLPKSDFKF